MHPHSFPQYIPPAPRPPKPVQPPPPPISHASAQINPSTIVTPQFPHMQQQLQYQYAYPLPHYIPSAYTAIPSSYSTYSTQSYAPFAHALNLPLNPAFSSFQQPIPFSSSYNSHQQQPQHRSKAKKPPSTALITPTAAPTAGVEQEYFCEPCDKSFKKEFDYVAHCKTHEKCSHPDCPFVGSKKVVAAHFDSRHGLYAGNGYKIIDVEGQKFNLLLGYSPEEIEDWKNQRRLKFPTKEKVEEKKQERLNRVSGRKRKEREGPDEEKEEEDGHTMISKKKMSPKKRRNSLLTVPKPLAGGERGTLLMKLLEDQISEEEELLLQCVTFIYDSKFFIETSNERDLEKEEEEKEEEDADDDNPSFSALMAAYADDPLESEQSSSSTSESVDGDDDIQNEEEEEEG